MKEWYNVYVGYLRINPIPFKTIKEADNWRQNKLDYELRKQSIIQPVRTSIIMMEKRKYEKED